MKYLSYFSLLKSKLFWKAVYIYIKYLFVGMDQHEDCSEICKKAKIEAINVFVMPLVTACLESLFIENCNKTKEMIIEYFSVFKEMEKFVDELRKGKDLNEC